MNDVRTRLEDLEYELLSPYAAKSREAVRDVDEEPSDIRTAYQRSCELLRDEALCNALAATRDF